MTEKQYRLNKWATKLLKNNRPLFDWVNESDEIVDLLNDLNDENEQLKKEGLYWSQNAEARKKEIERIKKENNQLKQKIKSITEILK